MSHGLMSKKIRQYHQQYLFKFSPLEADLRKCPQKTKDYNIIKIAQVDLVVLKKNGYQIL